MEEKELEQNNKKEGECDMKERVCQKCKKENVQDANYCEYCGTKISEVCPSCWKKEGQPDSCPSEKCK